jgi:hypothetical protein
MNRYVYFPDHFNVAKTFQMASPMENLTLDYDYKWIVYVVPMLFNFESDFCPFAIIEFKKMFLGNLSHINVQGKEHLADGLYYAAPEVAQRCTTSPLTSPLFSLDSFLCVDVVIVDLRCYRRRRQ